MSEEDPGEYLVAAEAKPATVAALTAWLAERDLPLADLRAGRHRLEDVFLRLTTRATGPDVPAPAGSGGVGGRSGLRLRLGRPGGAVPAGPAGPEPGHVIGPWQAQTRAEVTMTLRRGESVLLTLGIPVGLLVFFSLVDVLPKPAGVTHR